MFDQDEYRKAWPKGLVTYSDASRGDLSHTTSSFMLTVGLPRGHEPEWQFSGHLDHLPPHGTCFGSHGVSPLVITPRDTVEKVRPEGDSIHLNESVEHFAACLTLRKRAGRSSFPLRTVEDVDRFRDAFRDADESAIVDGSFWAAYLDEVEGEVREMTSDNE